MGMNGFHQTFCRVSRQVQLSQFRGKRKPLVCDTQLYLNRNSRGTYGSLADSDTPPNIKKIALDSLIKLTTKFLDCGIALPIHVFDGKTPDLKRKCVDKRSKDKYIASELCETASDKSTDEYSRNFKRTFYLTKDVMETCRQFLRATGVTVIKAHGEADSQLAALSRHYDLGVLTEDSDILLFGGVNIYKDFMLKNNTLNEYTLIELLQFLLQKTNVIRENNNLSPIDEIGRENLIDFAIISGTSYGDSISIITNGSGSLPKNIMREKLFEAYVLNDMNIIKMVQWMYDENNKGKPESYKIPPDFIDQWHNERNNYLNENVINPGDIDISLSSPNPDKILALYEPENDYEIRMLNNLIEKLQHNYKIHQTMMEANLICMLSEFKQNLLNNYHKFRMMNEFDFKSYSFKMIHMLRTEHNIYQSSIKKDLLSLIMRIYKNINKVPNDNIESFIIDMIFDLEVKYKISHIKDHSRPISLPSSLSSYQLRYAQHKLRHICRSEHTSKYSDEFTQAIQIHSP